jgi:hypothetical protein
MEAAPVVTAATSSGPIFAFGSSTTTTTVNLTPSLTFSASSAAVGPAKVQDLGFEGVCLSQQHTYVRGYVSEAQGRAREGFVGGTRF